MKRIACRLLALVLFGTSMSTAYAQQPAPGGSVGRYTFTLENFQILDTRSVHEDTDHVTFALKVGDKVYPPQIKHVGDVNNGTHKVQLSFGPIDIPSPKTPVVMTYLIVNQGHDQDKVSQYLEKGANALIDHASSSAGGWGVLISFLHEVVPILFANCDGWVAGDRIALTGADLAKWGPSHRETRFYAGIKSAVGCGGNSRYKVTWSVIRK